MYFCLKTFPNAGWMLHISSLFSCIFARRAGETFAALSCSDCRHNPHVALADLACGAACLFDAAVPGPDDSSAFCPLSFSNRIACGRLEHDEMEARGANTCWWFSLF